ncbi:hypothetical protein [Burkholderia pseudomallei]|uniref:hypothetical protein n=1 Tax=Burkholderia pseudomallei TaxID=28450 RepID=UPI0011782C2C|nr:hypothetical protein [Burkholderia pseudomallei]
MAFESFNHLRRDLRLDPKDWVNAEHARFLKQGGIERTPQNVGYCPEWLLRQSFVCPNGHTFVPDWLAKRPPLMPFMSEGKLFRPGAGEVACPRCATRFEVGLPSVPKKDDVSLYGDEAMRDIVTPGCDNRYCVTYTLISRPRVAAEDKELLAAYRVLKKARLGADTVVHCKALFHDGRRSAARLPTEQVSVFLGEVADLLASWAGRLVILNCAGVVFKPQAFNKKEQAACKARGFGPLVQFAIEQMTKQGLCPHFYFERTNDDGWAKDLFAGGRLTLMWPFITNTLPVKSPEFVLPTASEYLEFADIVSFAVADNIARRAKERDGNGAPARPRIDLARFGTVHYQGFMENGDAISKSSVGYPWQDFYRGTAWA